MGNLTHHSVFLAVKREETERKLLQVTRMVKEDFAFNYEKENMENILTDTRKPRFKPLFPRVNEE